MSYQVSSVSYDPACGRDAIPLDPGHCALRRACSSIHARQTERQRDPQNVLPGLIMSKLEPHVWPGLTIIFTVTVYQGWS